MTEIKLLLADVDGTLVTKEKQLTPRTIAAVQAMRARGIGFAVTSGRPPRGMQMLVGPLGIDTPMAGFNGGQWVNPDLSQIEARTLPRAVAEDAVRLIVKAGLDPWVYAGEDWLVHDSAAPHVEREAWTVKFAPKVAGDFGAALDSAVKIVGVSDDVARVEAAEKTLQSVLGDGASVARSQPYYLDVTHPQANKGAAILFLAERLGLRPEQIATIGDQPNDVLMFKKSGLSIAMGNASQQVQHQADRVTTSSEDEGFANAVQRFILAADHG